MTKTDITRRFGRLGREARGDALQTATTFVTQDAGTTPKVSPLLYSSSVITIAVPDDAVQLVLSPSTDLRVSEDPSIAHYDVVTAGSKEALPVVLMQTVYIQRDTVDGTLFFRFARV
jgi:hypothetical protein